MLNTVINLINQPSAPFEKYYQDFICKMQDKALDNEIKAYENSIIHMPVESQLDDLWKLLI